MHLIVKLAGCLMLLEAMTLGHVVPKGHPGVSPRVSPGVSMGNPGMTQGGRERIVEESPAEQEVGVEAHVQEVSSAQPQELVEAPTLSPKLKPIKVRRAVDSRVSVKDQEVIVDKHNLDRENVKPTAKDMRRIYWSPDLARSAQALADECRKVKHDDSYERRKKSGLNVPIGQNYALGPNSTGWLNVIQAWHNEVDSFKFGISTRSGIHVGHYTQEVRGPSGLVGCGSQFCPKLGGRSFYCNYQFPNMDYMYPYMNGTSCSLCPNHCYKGLCGLYMNGTSCSLCPNHCYKGLCDCGPVNCQNGGVLNLRTCSCECKYGFKGESCAECPTVEESGDCRSGHYLTEDCHKYTNVPEVCPIMCGQCPDKCPGMSNSYCKNGGTLSSSCECECTEQYSGPQCECESESLMAAKPADADGICGPDEYPYAYPASRQWCAYSGVVNTCPQMCNKVWCGTWSGT